MRILLELLDPECCCDGFKDHRCDRWGVATTSTAGTNAESESRPKRPSRPACSSYGIIGRTRTENAGITNYECRISHVGTSSKYFFYQVHATFLAKSHYCFSRRPWGHWCVTTTISSWFPDLNGWFNRQQRRMDGREASRYHSCDWFWCKLLPIPSLTLVQMCATSNARERAGLPSFSSAPELLSSLGHTMKPSERNDESFPCFQTHCSSSACRFCHSQDQKIDRSNQITRILTTI